MENQQKVMRANQPLMALLMYCVASLIHFAHNAVFLDDYPNMPASISAGGICVAWLAVTGVGLAGYLLVRRENTAVGLITLAVYGVLGFDGLSHYILAPISAHSFIMNLTIWTEAITALIALICVSVSANWEVRDCGKQG